MKKKYNLFVWVNESISGGPVPTLNLCLSTKGPRNSSMNSQIQTNAYVFHSWSALYQKIIELQKIWNVQGPLELEIQLQEFIAKGGSL